jgi:hypothetical protein
MGHDLKGGKIYALKGEPAPATPKKPTGKKVNGGVKSTSGSGEDSDEKDDGSESKKRKVPAEQGHGQEHKKPKVEDDESDED